MTGKYGTKRKPEQGRLVQNTQYSKRYSLPEYYEVTDRFIAYTKEKGVKPATLAVAWVMAHPAITAPIIGARNLLQLEDSLAALKVRMTPEWRAEISALSIEPAPATDRLETKV